MKFIKVLSKWLSRKNEIKVIYDISPQISFLFFFASFVQAVEPLPYSAIILKENEAEFLMYPNHTFKMLFVKQS